MMLRCDLRRIRCALTVLLIGCRGATSFLAHACDSGAPLSLPAVQRDSLRQPDATANPDAQWARLARISPGGFAGAYWEVVPRDSRGLPTRAPRVVIRLVHPEQRGPALHALLPALPPTFGGLAIDSADVLIVGATWDFAQLDEWRRYLDDRVGAPGITSIDADEASNQIRYGVRDAAARDALEKRLRDLHAPCGLVRIDVVGTPTIGTG